MNFLSERFTYHSRSEWEELIRTGAILVNSCSSAAEQELFRNDVVEYQIPAHVEPAVDLQVEQVYEDSALLVLDKPAHLPCHPAGKYFQNTIWGILKERGFEKVHFINRLDRETSGLLVIAKDADSAKKCRQQWASHQVIKKYNVFVEGLFPGKLIASGRIIPDELSEIRKTLKFEIAGKAECETSIFVSTEFRLLEQYEGISLLEAVPKTGRTHQIRATLCGLGFPVIGDKMYGVDETLFLRFIANELSEQDKAKLRLDRQTLHAAELHFRHPLSDELLHFYAPLPSDMRNLISKAALQGL